MLTGSENFKPILPVGVVFSFISGMCHENAQHNFLCSYCHLFCLGCFLLLGDSWKNEVSVLFEMLLFTTYSFAT